MGVMPQQVGAGRESCAASPLVEPPQEAKSLRSLGWRSVGIRGGLWRAMVAVMPDGPLTSCDLSNIDLDARIGAPVVPPIEWLMEKPSWAKAGMDPTVDTCNEIGRGFGYVAAWQTRFLNHHPLLQSARQLRNADTSYFNRRRVAVIEDGEQTTVLAGVIGAGHSPDTLTDVRQIQQFHDRPERALLVARYDTDDFGAFVNFVMIPEATWAQVVQVQRSAFSGEWFPLTHSIDTGERLSRPVWAVLAPALVSHPALPLPVAERSIGPGGQLVAAGMHTVRSHYGATMSDDEPTPHVREITTMADEADRIIVDGETYQKVTAASEDETPDAARGQLSENDPAAADQLAANSQAIAELQGQVAELVAMVSDMMASDAPEDVALNEG